MLVGQDLQHGLAPLWNPYLFSGTPLLGGFNAGAAYPMTWLTAVLPIFTAWTLGLVLAYDVAIVGMYALPAPAGRLVRRGHLGAATFALAGYMSGPDRAHRPDRGGGLAALDAAGRPRADRTGDPPTSAGGRRLGQHGGCGWAAVFAGTFGLSILAGAAEAIIDSAVLIGIYWSGAWSPRATSSGPTGAAWSPRLGPLAGGRPGAWSSGPPSGSPGLEFLSQSQRSTASYHFFTSGPLTRQLVTLLSSPFALGTNQTYPVFYAGPYNFPEVTSYMGILALIAAGSLFLRRWRQRPEAPHWWIWYVIIVVGLLSALGGQTPFAHLMYLIPGINDERLLNRNLLLVDFSLAVLLAWWLHLLLEERAPAGPGYVPVRRRWQPGRRSELVVTCRRLALIVILCLFLWI